jgi:hypothetical protein
MIPETPADTKLCTCSSLIKKKKKAISRAPVAHIYNPSYSGGRDQEDQSSRSAQENNS